ncbi:hypothetical protein D1872_346100 [compost metagenome]
MLSTQDAAVFFCMSELAQSFERDVKQYVGSCEAASKQIKFKDNITNFPLNVDIH